MAGLIADAVALRALEEEIFRRGGFKGTDAATIADVIMQADSFGIASQGVKNK